MNLRLFSGVALVTAAVMASYSTNAAEVLRPKVVVVTMFEAGEDTGDRPGEFQFWVEREKLSRVWPFPQGYRDLRTKYYGSNSYDFSEATLLFVADRLAQSRAAVAIAIADLNLEFYPKSWRSYLARGIAQSRRLDTTPDAVDSFKKALEIDPENGVVQGWLAQTEPVARRLR